MRPKKGIKYVNLKSNLINEVAYPPLFIKRVAEKGGLNISGFNMDELTNGYKVELEHGTKAGQYNVTHDDPVETLKIVMAHLSEDKHYYHKLLKYVESDISEKTESKNIKDFASTKHKGLHEKVEEIGLLTQGNHKLYITKSVDNFDDNKMKLMSDFIKFCCKQLGINQPITVHLTGKRGGPIQTTASFNPNNNEIWIYVKNRNMLADPMRSLAHEIRHLKQNIDGVIIPTSGDDGSPHENEAHSFSGLMIRLFGKIHPEIFE